MKSSIGYFYDGMARSEFGFENPNKAAVIFVCLLPLLLIGWNLAWSWKKPRWIFLSIALLLGILLLSDAFCLFKTYSRGGVLAAGVGVLYLFVRTDWRGLQLPWARRIWSARAVATIALFFVIGALFVWIGLGQRSLNLVSDASASHRLILWHAASQMAVENPFGFGTGNSGEAYTYANRPK